MIKANDFAVVRKALSNCSAVYKKFVIMSEFVAMAGLFFDVIASGFKLPWITKGKPHEVPEKLKQVSISVGLLIIMPNYILPRSDSDAWFWKFDSVITDLAFLEICLDASKIEEKEIDRSDRVESRDGQKGEVGCLSPQRTS